MEWRLVVNVFIRELINQFIKGSSVESFEDARKKYKKLLEEGWKKTFIFKFTYLQ